MIAFLMLIPEVECPRTSKGLFEIEAGLDGIRGLVTRIDQRALIPGTEQTRKRSIDSLERIDPSVRDRLL